MKDPFNSPADSLLRAVAEDAEPMSLRAAADVRRRLQRRRRLFQGAMTAGATALVLSAGIIVAVRSLWGRQSSGKSHGAVFANQHGSNSISAIRNPISSGIKNA